MRNTTTGTSAPVVNLTILPVRRYTNYLNEAYYVFEASEAQILESGLLPEERMMPSNRVQSFRRCSFHHSSGCSRLKNGNLRLRISADIVIPRDAAFMRFFGGLLADTRLSLVAGEKGAEA